MGTTKAELTPQGELKLLGSVDTRLPVITDGLIAHFPFDNTAYDSVYGVDPIVPINANINLMEAVDLDWRDVSNWTRHTQTGSISWNEEEQAIEVTNGWWGYFNQWFKIDTSKNWYIEAKVKRVSGSGTFYLGDIAYNDQKSTSGISQKPGTHEYWGAIGYSPSSDEYTLYKNSAIGGLPRTGENTNTGDYDTWYTGTSWIRYLFIANYNNAVGTTFIKDLKLYYTDAAPSDMPTITEEGISVEEATTNLIINSSLNNLTGWTVSGSQVALDGIVTLTGNAPLGGEGTGYIYQDFTGTAGTYTLSYWARTSGATMETVGGDSGALVRFDATAIFNRIDPYTEWTYYSHTFTFDGSGRLEFSIHDVTSGGVFQIKKPQLEFKGYSTAYVDGSRSSQELDIPLSTTSSNFTLFYKFKPSVYWADVLDTSYNRYMWYLYDKNTNFKIWSSDYHGNGDMLVSSPWIGFDEIEYYHWHTEYYSWPDGGEYYFALTKNGTTWTRYMSHSTGSFIQTLERTHADIVAFAPNKIVFPDDYCQTIRDFSFYERALSADEINELINNNFELKTTGDLFIPGIDSKPDIPDNVVWFPLGFDNKDEYKLFNPSYHDNPIYENGSTWVGEGTTNLVASPFNHTLSYAMSISVMNSQLLNFDDNYTASTLNGSGYYAYLYTGTTDTRYTTTWYLKAGSLSTVSINWGGGHTGTRTTFNVDLNTGDIGSLDLASGEFYGVERSLNGFYKIWVSSTLSGTAYYPQLNIGTGNIIMGAIQIEQRPYASPFIDGTRGNGRLKYTFSSNILNGTSDWTVGVFAKGNKYNIDDTTDRISVIEVGNYYNENQSDVSWGRWNYGSRTWGLIAYDNRVGKYGGGTTLSTDDAYGWCLYILKYVAADATVYGQIIGQSGTVYTSNSVNRTFAGLVPSVRLGGYNWDEDNWDGYLRDFFIADRALTDQELLNIAKNKMEQSSDKLRVLSNIETGIELG